MRNLRRHILPFALFAAPALAASPVASAQTAPAGNPFMAPIVTQDMGGGIYQLSAGSNAVLIVGTDSAILVDTLFFNPDKLLEAVRAITLKPVKYVVSTHAHRDHTGGNATFGKLGATIISTPNAARRIAESSTNMRGEISPPIDQAGWPTITYARVTTIRVPGRALRFIPVRPSHMDGDAMVFLPRENVLILGDLHHSHEYPVYDAQAGCRCGSYEGNLEVYRQALAMINDKTKVVAGHGGLTNRAELKAYLAMLEDIRTKVRAQIAAGRTKEEVVAMKLLAGDKSVHPGGPDNADAFIGTLYTALKTGVGA
jgi:glyoxylase-like metal-dependent hydrolase (beta-lactamase superfamily II)